MRRFFARGAQRDVLRQTENKKSNIKKSKNGIERDHLPRASKGKQLVTAFLLAALGNEASHFHEAHNPHGNRRERIEEIRMRMQEAETHTRRFRNMAHTAGGPQPLPHPAVIEDVVKETRRRRIGPDMNQA
jgi:hypothetical protein